jgi:hypothetical protein
MSSRSVLQHNNIRGLLRPRRLQSGCPSHWVGDDHGGSAEELATARAEFDLVLPTSANVLPQSLVSEASLKHRFLRSTSDGGEAIVGTRKNPGKYSVSQGKVRFQSRKVRLSTEGGTYVVALVVVKRRLREHGIVWTTFSMRIVKS